MNSVEVKVDGIQIKDKECEKLKVNKPVINFMGNILNRIPPMHITSIVNVLLMLQDLEYETTNLGMLKVF